MFDKLKAAKEAWEKGRFVLIHDSKGRENEVDLVIPSSKVTPKHVATMRMDGGGLICTTVTHEFAHEISLPFMRTVLTMTSHQYPAISMLTSHSLPYGAKSAFSLTINHVDSFTGITDHDRALTMSELGKIHYKFETGELRGKELLLEFGNKFRAPGHVHLLRAAPGLLRNRKGHTELSVALAQLTKQPQSISLVEMLDANTGRALKVEDALKYGEENDYPLLTGDEILKLWKSIFKIPSAEFKS